MKKIKLAAFLTLVGSGFYAQSAQAAGLTYTQGDIFIGFTNGVATSNDYLVDVGQASLYTAPGSTFELNATYIGSPSQDSTNLQTVLPDPMGWWGGTNTNWGIIGGPLSGDNASLLYMGVPRYWSDSVPSTAPTPDSFNNQGSYVGAVSQMEDEYKHSGTPLNGTTGTSQAQSDTNSFAAISNSGGFGSAFGVNNINTDGTGTVGDVIDLWKMGPSGGPAPIYEGDFTINSTGAITYTPAVAAPEPSTWATLIGGAALLGLIRRRRAVVA